MNVFYKRSQILPQKGDTVHVARKHFHDDVDEGHSMGGVQELLPEGKLAVKVRLESGISKTIVLPSDEITFIWRPYGYMEPKERDLLYPTSRRPEYRSPWQQRSQTTQTGLKPNAPG